jgi:hypothetical protein
LRPWRPLGLIGVLLLAVALVVGSSVLLVVAGTVLVAAIAPAAWSRSKSS